MLALSVGRATAMARAPAGLPAGIRLSDHVSLGVIAKTFPLDQVRQVLAETGKASERERDLPAHVMVYYAIALALYMGSSTREVMRCLLEGLRWLWGAQAVKVAGESGFPQVRFVALVENGTHVLFGARLGGLADGETTLAHDALPALRPGMLCLADRQFFGHALWQAAAATGADLLWRVKRNLRLPREAVLADGSYLTTVYPGEKDRRHKAAGVQVRAVDYRLEGVADAEPPYRLGTKIPDPAAAPAAGLGGLYHERWEVEGALAELKAQLRGARVVLRSKTPALVRQEFWGLLLAHFAVRGLMHEAALKADEDPDRLSFSHAVRVVRRKVPLFAALSPSGQARPA